jgi:hypothetical protein
MLAGPPLRAQGALINATSRSKAHLMCYGNGCRFVT